MNRPQTRDGLPQPQRRRAMLVVLTGLSMSVLDGAIANIALPTIATELHTEPASAVWVINAYQQADKTITSASAKFIPCMIPGSSFSSCRATSRLFGISSATESRTS